MTASIWQLLRWNFLVFFLAALVKGQPVPAPAPAINPQSSSTNGALRSKIHLNVDHLDVLLMQT